MASKPLNPRAVSEVTTWYDSADVVVVGFGAAGACAALGARERGAEVLIIEADAAGGGTTALSGGQIYLGGGTATQLACGIEDTLEAMYEYVCLSAGPYADLERVRCYVDGNIAHHDWLLAQGVEFLPVFVPDKTNNTRGEEGLLYSGNEACYPYDEVAAPAPRGHKHRAVGEAGAEFAAVLTAAALTAGARLQTEARVLTSIVDEHAQVVGVVARIDGEEHCIRAQCGVVLCAGGFIMNQPMVSRYAPRLQHSNFPLGNPNDTGSGIMLGQGVGAAVANMHEGFISLPFYPPSNMVEGILVDASGQRVVAEDCYHGRMGEVMFSRPQDKFYLIIDSRHFSSMEKQPMGGYSVAQVGETIAELEQELALPEGALCQTLEYYNRKAAAGEDPAFHKRPPYVVPLDQPPYAALDFSLGGGAWFPAFTFGGLVTSLHGEVLTPEGEPIGGLYAAGRTTFGLPQCGATYSSGLSLGDATFFGRRAGIAAAEHETGSEGGASP